MSRTETIVQKHFKLGAFYEQFSLEIAQLYQQATCANPNYHPQNVKNLLANQCKSDSQHVNVIAIYAKDNQSERLIAVFPYEIQTRRWLLAIKCYISWWDDLIDDNSPLMHKGYMDIISSEFTNFLKTSRAYYLVHQTNDHVMIKSMASKTVYINVIYSGSKLHHKLILKGYNPNKIKILTIDFYIIFAEKLRIKIRDILNKKNL